MYIKLIRLDGSPIYINASFIVTIEPRKGGGSIVVPIGDGLDYDVRESPEKVLAMLGDAPAPAIVPVPAPKGLAPTAAADVSPDDFTAVDSAPVKEAPAKDAVTATNEDAPVIEEEAEATPEAPAEPDVFANAVPPAKADSPVVSVLPEDAPSSATATTEKKPARAKKTRTTTRKSSKKKPVLDLDEDQIARLKKLSPGSIRKLQNTLTAQFNSQDPESTIAALMENGHFVVDRDHLIWC